MRRASDRNFAVAVAASVLAHALLLLTLPGLLDPAKRKPSVSPIVTRLIPVVPPRPPPAAEPRIEPRIEQTARPARSAPVKNPRLAAPAQQPIAAPAPQALPVPESSRVAEVPAVAPLAAPAFPAAKVESAASPPAVSPAAEAADPLTLGQYRIAIIATARRYKKYPRLALDNNWQGQAEIRMAIGADGSIASIRVKTGSGFEVLDQQALEMIRKAMPLTPIPSGLRGKGFTVDVPVVFSLQEAG